MEICALEGAFSCPPRFFLDNFIVYAIGLKRWVSLMSRPQGSLLELDHRYQAVPPCFLGLSFPLTHEGHAFPVQSMAAFQGFIVSMGCLSRVNLTAQTASTYSFGMRMLHPLQPLSHTAWTSTQSLFPLALQWMTFCSPACTSKRAPR